MSIITLFCEIDDFFFALMKHQTAYHLQQTQPLSAKKLVLTLRNFGPNKRWHFTYTSQTCPSCGDKHKPSNREYKCKCGFTYHRDGVGAINIRQKYLGCLGNPVAATMASPIGIRLEVRCCSV